MANSCLFALFFALITLSMTCKSCEGYGYQYRFRSRYETTLATFNAALLPTFPELENRVTILTEQVRQTILHTDL